MADKARRYFIRGTTSHVDDFPRGIYSASLDYAKGAIGVPIADSQLKAFDSRNEFTRPRKHLELVSQLDLTNQSAASADSVKPQVDAREILQGSKPFDLVDNTANLLGHFMDDEAQRGNIEKNILHAASRTVSSIGFKGQFLDMFDLNAVGTINEAAAAAERFAQQLYTDKDSQLAMASDAYSLIAVLCYGRLGRYSISQDQKVYQMAAQLFGAVVSRN